MAYQLPNLIWLRSFEASARTGSFTAAAAELGLTQAAISLHIRSLEETLGYPLFYRRARILDLTEMGIAYLPSVKRAIEDLAFATQGLFGPVGEKSVTVRAPISTVVLWLAPKLKTFREQWPDINIRFMSAIWANVIADHKVDIDIRLGNGEWPGSHVELLSTETVSPICHPAKSGKILCAADLLKEELIHIHGYQDHWARHFLAANVAYDQKSIGLSVDTSLAAVEIVASGGGVALVTTRLARYLEEVNRVSIPLKSMIGLGESHYFVSPLDQGQLSTEAKILKDWMIEAFRDG